VSEPFRWRSLGSSVNGNCDNSITRVAYTFSSSILDGIRESANSSQFALIALPHHPQMPLTLLHPDTHPLDYEQASNKLVTYLDSFFKIDKEEAVTDPEVQLRSCGRFTRVGWSSPSPCLVLFRNKTQSPCFTDDHQSWSTLPMRCAYMHTCIPHTIPCITCSVPATQTTRFILHSLFTCYPPIHLLRSSLHPPLEF
jgi:hypothetical protein